MENEKVVTEEVTKEETVAAETAMENAVPTEGAPVITVKKLLEAGSQFGHQTKR